ARSSGLHQTPTAPLGPCRSRPVLARRRPSIRHWRTACSRGTARHGHKSRAYHAEWLRRCALSAIGPRQTRRSAQSPSGRAEPASLPRLRRYGITNRHATSNLARSGVRAWRELGQSAAVAPAIGDYRKSAESLPAAGWPADSSRENGRTAQRLLAVAARATAS